MTPGWATHHSQLNSFKKFRFWGLSPGLQINISGVEVQESGGN